MKILLLITALAYSISIMAGEVGICNGPEQQDQVNKVKVFQDNSGYRVSLEAFSTHQVGRAVCEFEEKNKAVCIGLWRPTSGNDGSREARILRATLIKVANENWNVVYTPFYSFMPANIDCGKLEIVH